MKQIIAASITALACAFSLQAADVPADSDSFALVRVSVANMRSKAGHDKELDSQVVMGTPVKILDKAGEWWQVESPEGYKGWINHSSLTPVTHAGFAAWRKAPRLVMTNLTEIKLYADSAANGPRDIISDLVNGAIVEGLPADRGRIEVKLPDGRTGWADATFFTPIGEWADQPFDAQKILDTAYSMEGQPYLWGGTSTKSLDCSGLSKVSYLSNGRILLRNASQQARTGRRIEAADWRSCQPGDLLFFGNAATGKVTHVAIYDHDGNYVHSSGRVKRNSVDPKSPAYLTTPFLWAVRIAGHEGTPGITRAIDHPWYF